jgi:hypothetical protein
VGRVKSARSGGERHHESFSCADRVGGSRRPSRLSRRLFRGRSVSLRATQEANLETILRPAMDWPDAPDVLRTLRLFDQFSGFLKDLDAVPTSTNCLRFTGSPPVHYRFDAANLHRTQAIARPQLPQYAVNVVLYRVYRQIQLVRNLLVAQPLAHHLD